MAARLDRIHAARTRLLLERSFLGTLALHFEIALAPANRVRRVACNGRRLIFAADFVSAASLGELMFALAHEALHCALGHPWRRGHRLRERWGMACDYAVNQLLADEGMSLPGGILISLAYRGLAAEEIYPLLTDDGGGKTYDSHDFGSSTALEFAGSEHDSALEDYSADMAAAHDDGLDEIASRSIAKVTSLPAARELESEWRARLQGSALAALRAGRLAPMWQRSLPQLSRPQLSWRSLLARFVASNARNDYSYGRGSRREGAAILPRLAEEVVELVVALDISGSIARNELEEFLDAVDALKGQIRAAITLHACDATLAPEGPWRFEVWEPLQLPGGLVPGGGTRFSPVFEWLAAELRRPDALLYFTDAQGEFPAVPPAFPVLWLVKGNAPVPWGERVQLN